MAGWIAVLFLGLLAAWTFVAANHRPRVADRTTSAGASVITHGSPADASPIRMQTPEAA